MPRNPDRSRNWHIDLVEDFRCGLMVPILGYVALLSPPKQAFDLCCSDWAQLRFLMLLIFPTQGYVVLLNPTMQDGVRRWSNWWPLHFLLMKVLEDLALAPPDLKEQGSQFTPG